MTSRLAVGRIIAVTIVAVLGVFGVWAWMSAKGYQRELDVQPATMEVDLSRTGVTEAPYVQSTQAPHSEGVWVDLAGSSGSIGQFKGKLTIVDGTGAVQAESQLDLVNAQEGQPARIGSFHPLPRGAYTTRLEVTTPSEGLKGTQRLRIEHELCGLEALPIVVMKLAGGAAGVLAIVIVAFTAPGLVRHGWRKA